MSVLRILEKGKANSDLPIEKMDLQMACSKICQLPGLLETHIEIHLEKSLKKILLEESIRMCRGGNFLDLHTVVYPD